MKLDIHIHSANAEYKSTQSNVTVNHSTGEISHEPISDMTDDRFISQVDNAKLIKIWHTEDERDNVRASLLNMQENYHFSDDIEEVPCRTGGFLTTIHKVVRPAAIDDSAGLSRFSVVQDR
jgi:hypothetical protein